MATLPERLKSPTLRRTVKQRRMVLDVTTALEDELNRRNMTMTAFARRLGKSKALVSRIFRRQPNLTFFTAVELADVLGMDIKIEVVPRGALAGIARPDERRGAAGSGGTGIAPVASRDARRGKARR
jgi:transcriptional regulator with XRE-family HTH domain